MKKEKTKLRVIQILCIVSLLVTVFSIQKTYAKYFEKVDTTYATNIKKWAIEVNDIYIHEETTLSNVMNPTFFYNENMDNNGGSNNILVPGREGCFDFLIDYSNVDVGFKFAFDIEQLNKKTVIDETINAIPINNKYCIKSIIGYNKMYFVIPRPAALSASMSLELSPMLITSLISSPIF